MSTIPMHLDVEIILNWKYFLFRLHLLDRCTEYLPRGFEEQYFSLFTNIIKSDAKLAQFIHPEEYESVLFEMLRDLDLDHNMEIAAKLQMFSNPETVIALNRSMERVLMHFLIDSMELDKKILESLAKEMHDGYKLENPEPETANEVKNKLKTLESNKKMATGPHWLAVIAKMLDLEVQMILVGEIGDILIKSLRKFVTTTNDGDLLEWKPNGQYNLAAELIVSIFNDSAIQGEIIFKLASLTVEMFKQKILEIKPALIDFIFEFIATQYPIYVEFQTDYDFSIAEINQEALKIMADQIITEQISLVVVSIMNTPAHFRYFNFIGCKIPTNFTFDPSMKLKLSPNLVQSTKFDVDVIEKIKIITSCGFKSGFSMVNEWIMALIGWKLSKIERESPQITTETYREQERKAHPGETVKPQQEMDQIENIIRDIFNKDELAIEKFPSALSVKSKIFNEDQQGYLRLQIDLNKDKTTSTTYWFTTFQKYNGQFQGNLESFKAKLKEIADYRNKMLEQKVPETTKQEIKVEEATEKAKMDKEFLIVKLIEQSKRPYTIKLKIPSVNIEQSFNIIALSEEKKYGSKTRVKRTIDTNETCIRSYLQEKDNLIIPGSMEMDNCKGAQHTEKKIVLGEDIITKKIASGIKMLYVDPDGSNVDRKLIKIFDESGKELPKFESSYDTGITLDKMADIDEILDHDVDYRYILFPNPENETEVKNYQLIIAELKKNEPKFFKFKFVPTSIERDAFLQVISEQKNDFLLLNAGYKRVTSFTEPEKIEESETETDIEESELEFSPF